MPLLGSKGVTFVPSPTKYIAKQVLVSENTAAVLQKALESPASSDYSIGIKKSEEE